MVTVLTNNNEMFIDSVIDSLIKQRITQRCVVDKATLNKMTSDTVIICVVPTANVFVANHIE